MVTSLSLWTPTCNSCPADVQFMVDKGALVQVFLQGFAGSVLFNQCSIFFHLSLTLLTLVKLQILKLWSCISMNENTKG